MLCKHPQHAQLSLPTGDGLMVVCNLCQDVIAEYSWDEDTTPEPMQPFDMQLLDRDALESCEQSIYQHVNSLNEVPW
jgi:hypothetical protein